MCELLNLNGEKILALACLSFKLFTLRTVNKIINDFSLLKVYSALDTV